MKNHVILVNFSAALLNHVCQGVTYSQQVKDDYRCTSLGGNILVLSHYNGKYYCNNFPVIKIDIPSIDGVVYLIDGLIHDQITTPKPEATTPSLVTVTSTIAETTETLPYEVTESTTSTPPSPISIPVTTEIYHITPPTEYSTVTEETTQPPLEPEIETTTLELTEYPQVIENVTEYTVIPTVTPEVLVNVTEMTEKATLTPVPPEIPAVTLGTTAEPEVTPALAVTVPTNQSIPQIIEQQFQNVGYPVDISDLEPYLPDTFQYTACVPSSIYLLHLPGTLLHDLATNKSAFTCKYTILPNHCHIWSLEV